jgi:Transposase DDE domain
MPTGLPVRLALTPGEAHDNRLAGKLLARLKSGSMLLADREYDAGWIRELAIKKGAWANIPPKSNRNDPISFRPLSLPRPQPGRAVLQSDQAMSSGRYALRQACRQLPCVRPACIHPAVAGCALMSPRSRRYVRFSSPPFPWWAGEVRGRVPNRIPLRKR